MPENALARETSPYLLQHKDNPVQWLPWGEEAFARARAEDKPVLLSIGYAACHWCHVMAHESFESPAIAALMNAHFINVKVDREERPDVDRLYMDALHALGEQGGWPLTMFLGPDGRPFWGGTYFPPESRYGRPGFPHLLTEISRIWREERQKAEANSHALAEALKPDPSATGGGALSRDLLTEAARAVAQAVDRQHGGLKGAPKFPQVSIFEFLRRMALRQADDALLAPVRVTLDNICQGGIYDHLAGGFARYSVDARWLVPHFEKMLYDNAQLVGLLTRMWQATRSELYRRRVEETVAFVLSEMRAPEGGFASSYDADSEGEEGKFYVWRAEEIETLVAPEDRDLFRSVYDVTPAGNWEGHTILNRLGAMQLLDEAMEKRLARARAVLRLHRADRVPPGFDDKLLADWNGLMVAALAEAGLVFDRPDWIETAREAFADVLKHLWDGERLHHAYRAGVVRNLASADDYANLITAALALFEATGDRAVLERASALARAMERHLWDSAHGGFYFSSDAAGLMVRQRHAHDDATPNANGTILSNYARLALLDGNSGWSQKAEATHRAFARAAAGNPFAFAGFLSGFDDVTGLVQAVVVGDPALAETKALERGVLETALPSRLLIRVDGSTPLPQGHIAADKPFEPDRATLYLCIGQTCSLPIRRPDEIPSALAAFGLSKRSA
ncbi:MAG: thioredoxin domain-containing protein [Parvibaculaceae bacterium]